MMKGERDMPTSKLKYDNNNEINVYGFDHQAVLMPEDGNHHSFILLTY